MPRLFIVIGAVVLTVIVTVIVMLPPRDQASITEETAEVTLYECGDGKDNDQDSFIDMEDDNCEDESDNSEAGSGQQAIDVSLQDCEAACGNYVTACLTLVPNATEKLFEEGFDSCMSECAAWAPEKVECMIGALSCEAMTNVCGL